MSSIPPDIRFDQPAEEASTAVNARLLSLIGGYIDELVQAADRRDWVSVGRLSAALSEGCLEAGAFELSGAAQQVASAARSGTNSANVRRALLRLIGAYGRVRRTRLACCLL